MARNTDISSRKRPQQARSADLVEAVLTAAVQVLTAEGPDRFTTARVAERAGVSIGSLYQYFPNKAAILFRLQSDEWRENRARLHAILADAAMPPATRLRRLAHGFIRSECAEAAIRLALEEAAPRYREAPEAEAARGEGASALEAFLAEAAPAAPAAQRRLAAGLMKTSLSAAGSHFSATPRTEPEIHAFAEALADMLCAYLERLARA
ncbi:TetR family transcriptional regulator [Sphingomonas morindae]|uniref:TetR family transcriptional regulator n=1 Tax=Sphingomonas morindae TaxID=1541170 RepID=A0ABY4X937_9SPHN|nr:TetR family transcriptional regulator [Sphingomonas morindae]USI73418.1 TetR family transcriptional regulator [Sphingomonas morindae]